MYDFKEKKRLHDTEFMNSNALNVGAVLQNSHSDASPI